MIRAQFQKRLHGVQGEFQLDVSLEVAEGEFVALYGPSGVGKTTLLRCLAGLTSPDAGQLTVDGETWLDTAGRFNLAPQQRRVGYMFQDYALFPNMTVRGNLEFALRRGTGKQRVDELLDLMRLGELQSRKPETLSGGQKQRVALARALASAPRLLLLDEPLSALDPEIRAHLQDEILRLQRHFGVTAIIVSHDVGEVYKLANRVLMMEAGRIVRHGSPAEVFSHGHTSGKFRFNGELLQKEGVDVMVALTVLIGNQLVRVMVMPEEAAAINPGDKIVLVSKAFNPMVLRLSRNTQQVTDMK